MSKIVKYFFLILLINFVVLAGLSIIFENFDTGDDLLYSGREAIKNLIVAAIIAGTTTFIYKKRLTNETTQ